MTRTELIAALESLASERLALVRAKNNNYATRDDAWGNLGIIEDLTDEKVTREQGIYIRMSDKLSRLGNLMFGTQDSVSETIEDTLLDLANYADLALVSLRSRKSPADAAVEDGIEIIENRSIMSRVLEALKERSAKVA